MVITKTVETNANLVLVSIVSNQNVGTVGSVMMDGFSFTRATKAQVTQIINSVSIVNTSEIWYLMNPNPNGAVHSITISAGVGSICGISRAYTFSGVYGIGNTLSTFLNSSALWASGSITAQASGGAIVAVWGNRAGSTANSPVSWSPLNTNGASVLTYNTGNLLAGNLAHSGYYANVAQGLVNVQAPGSTMPGFYNCLAAVELRYNAALTATPTNTPTATRTASPSPTRTFTFTTSPTKTPSATITPTATVTPTPQCGYYGSNDTSGPYQVGAGVVVFKSVQLPAIVASNVQVDVYVSSGQGRVNAALYADDNGQPGTLWASGSPQTAYIGWNTINLPVASRPAARYWIAAVTDNTAKMTYSAPMLDKYGYSQFLVTFPQRLPAQNWLGDASIRGKFCHY